jgi:hypothetical protein
LVTYIHEMKMILSAALFFAAATAANAEASQEALWDAVYACKSGENHDGEKISQEASKEACIRAIDMLVERMATE